MKRKMNFHFLINVLVMGLLLTSCGQKAKEKDEEVRDIQNVNPYSWDTPMNAEQLLTEEEFEVAKSICSSFQEMRSYLASQSNPLNMDFRVETLHCGASERNEHSESVTMQSSRSDGVMMSTSPRSTMASDVLSDKHERLEAICIQVQNGSRPSNTISDASLRYQVNFFSGEGFEWLQIAEFKKNDSGVYYPYLIEKAAIFTSVSASRKEALGFTKTRAVHRPCANLTNSYVLQEWL